jgi:hypothetical protein
LVAVTTARFGPDSARTKSPLALDAFTNATCCAGERREHALEVGRGHVGARQVEARHVGLHAAVADEDHPQLVARAHAALQPHERGLDVLARGAAGHLRRRARRVLAQVHHARLAQPKARARRVGDRDRRVVEGRGVLRLAPRAGDDQQVRRALRQRGRGVQRAGDGARDASRQARWRRPAAHASPRRRRTPTRRQQRGHEHEDDRHVPQLLPFDHGDAGARVAQVLGQPARFDAV